MQAEPTTFEEEIVKKRGSLPSITFCEDARKVDTFQTFQDVWFVIIKSIIQRHFGSKPAISSHCNTHPQIETYYYYY